MVFAMKESQINMCDGPILPQMIRYTIPVLFTGILQQLFNAADVVLASRLGTSGSDAVAAVGSTTALTSLMINFLLAVPREVQWRWLGLGALETVRTSGKRYIQLCFWHL